jgi:hypothetical protein
MKVGKYKGQGVFCNTEKNMYAVTLMDKR